MVWIAIELKVFWFESMQALIGTPLCVDLHLLVLKATPIGRQRFSKVLRFHLGFQVHLRFQLHEFQLAFITHSYSRCRICLTQRFYFWKERKVFINHRRPKRQHHVYTIKMRGFICQERKIISRNAYEHFFQYTTSHCYRTKHIIITGLHHN